MLLLGWQGSAHQAKVTTIEPNTKYNHPTLEELAMTEYTPDTSATAVVLYSKCSVNYIFSDRQFHLVYDYEFKVKVLKPNGVSHANISIPYYLNIKDNRLREIVKQIDASAYNLEKGKIVQIIGAVIDVEFPQDAVPKVYDALKDKYSPVKPPVEIETPEVEEPIVAEGEFQDTKGHWAENLIYKMYRNKMITGVSDTMFEPDRPITRAEFLTLTLRWLKYEKDMEWSRHASSWGTPTFQAKIKAQQAVFDKAVASAGTENWYQEILTGAQFADLIDGALLSADYDLKANITREEMASMLMRAYRYLTFETIYGNGKDFADKAQIADWAQDDVRSLSAIGYLEGDETGNFRPKATATRAEAAALIQRVYEVVEIR